MPISESTGGATTFLRATVAVVLCAALIACAPRQAAERAVPDPRASVERIYVATEMPLDGAGPQFGEPRPQGLNFSHVDVSIPPTHSAGSIEWPDGAPDAASDFVVTGTGVYSDGRAMAERMRRHAGGGETVVYVHGYNSTFSESLYRFAQIRADFGVDGPGVLYAWPSAGDPRGYAYDRDSVLYSRDDFERVLTTLTETSPEGVAIMAHSMGAHLLMETLRQAALRGNHEMLDGINAVALMSPDIDPDVFRSQADGIGDLPDPFLIFTSRQDRALSLAGLITGRKPRLGGITGPEAVEGLDVKVIDFTALGDGEGLNHSIPATSPAAIGVLKGMIEQARGDVPAFRDYMVLTAQP